MTTLATGLPINTRETDAKITPSLRLAVQKATSVFQKDFCYDFIQAIVDEPEIADPIGVRLFLNFCLRKPDNLVDSFLDSLDQNLGVADDFSETADTILNELDNFLEFIHGLIDMIDAGEIFRLAYHEIDAWKLCYQLLAPIQHRLFDLAVQDRQHALNHSHQLNSKSEHPNLTFASESTSSGFYQAFVSIDKFLKHSFESRILLEPAKLVEDADQLAERRTLLQKFRATFPCTQNSNLLAKKHGRFGREETTIDQFLESEKFKELLKLKSTMSGGQLTRQPSTRTKKSSSKAENPPPSIAESNPKTKHLSSKVSPANASELEPKTKRNASTTSPATKKHDTDGAHPDPFLRVPASPPPPPLTKKTKKQVDSDSDYENEIIRMKKKSLSSGKPESNTSSTRRQGSARQSVGSTTGVSTTSTTLNKRKRTSRSASDQKDDTTNHAKRKKNRKSKSEKDNKDDDGQEELFVVDKIIAESVDIKGEVIYKVLWAGYPESEATWQFANTLDDCEALDIWQQNKTKTLSTNKLENNNPTENGTTITTTTTTITNDPNPMVTASTSTNTHSNGGALDSNTNQLLIGSTDVPGV